MHYPGEEHSKKLPEDSAMAPALDNKSTTARRKERRRMLIQQRERERERVGPGDLRRVITFVLFVRRSNEVYPGLNDNEKDGGGGRVHTPPECSRPTLVIRFAFYSIFQTDFYLSLSGHDIRSLSA